MTVTVGTFNSAGAALADVTTAAVTVATGDSEALTMPATAYALAYIKVTIGSDYTNIVSLSIRRHSSPGTTEALVFTDVADASTFSADFTAIRCVGMSVLVTSTGPALSTGGNIAVRRFHTEDFAGAALPRFSYEAIGSRPGSYTGAFVRGAYSFWAPMDLEDLKYRHPDYRDLLGSTFLAVAVSDATGAGTAARLRVVANWEVISSSQKYGLTPPSIDPLALTQAMVILGAIPSAYENDLHLKAIAGYIKRAASRLGKFAWANRGAIGSLAARGASAALDLSPAAASGLMTAAGLLI
jgi:hypothetical protein